MIDWDWGMALSAVRGFARYLSVISCLFLLVLSPVEAQTAPDKDGVAYEYDDLGRLVRVVYRRDGRRISYTYDAAGNRTEHIIGSATAQVRAWTHRRAFENDEIEFIVWRRGPSADDITIEYQLYKCDPATEALGQCTTADQADDGDYFLSEDGSASCSTAAQPAVVAETHALKNATIPAGGDYGFLSIKVPTCPDEDDDLEHVYLRLTDIVGGEFVNNGNPATYSIAKVRDLANPDSFILKRESVNGTREEGRPATFVVSKTGTVSSSTYDEITFSTDDTVYAATARAGLDYVPTEVKLTFYPGGYCEGSGTATVRHIDDHACAVEVPTIDDSIYEAGERIGGKLSNPSKGAGIGKEKLTVEIGDTADMPVMKISSYGVRDNSSYSDVANTTAVAQMTHGVWVDKDSTQIATGYYTVCYQENSSDPDHADYRVCNEFADEVTAEYADFSTADSGASSAARTEFNGTVLIAPEDSNIAWEDTINVYMRKDSADDGDERYVVVLHDVKNARLDRNERYYAYGILRDDDNPNGSVYRMTATGANAGSPVKFGAKRWGNTSGSRTLDYWVDTELSSFSVPSGIPNVQRPGRRAEPGVDYVLVHTRDNPGSMTCNSGAANCNEIQIQTLTPNLPYRGSLSVPVRIRTNSSSSNDRITVALAHATIIDPNVPVATVGSASGEEMSGEVRFPITLSRAFDWPVTIHYATKAASGSNAASITDLVHRSGSVTIPQGSTTGADIVITIRDDVDQDGLEGDETFLLNLWSDDVDLSSEQVTGTILNDENDGCNALMNVSSGASAGADESAGGQTVTATLGTGNCTTTTGSLVTMMGMQSVTTLPDGTPHEFQVEIVPGSAEEDEDFEAMSTVVTLSGLNNEATIPFEIIDDLVNEVDEDLMVRVTPMVDGDIAGGDAAVIILDNDPGPVFSVNDITTDENNLAIFTITKEGDAQATAAITYATIDGTATAGEDYIPASGILTFAQGEMSKQVIVNGIGDSFFEVEEEFYLELSAPTTGSAIEIPRATATISDDDKAPQFAITDATADEGDDLVFTVVLNEPSAFEHKVSFHTEDGSARVNIDYAALVGELTFAPGETEHTISVPTIDDASDEGPTPETLGIALHSPTNGATIGDLTAEGSIKDDETDGLYLLIEKKSYPATTTTATFDFNAALGGGSVGFTGHAPWSNRADHGPSALHSGVRETNGWCGQSGDNNKFGEWTFPNDVTIGKIFMINRGYHDPSLPTSVRVLVDGVEVVANAAPTSISQADGLNINYSGQGHYIQPRAAGKVWRLELSGSTHACAGEIEFHGLAGDNVDALPSEADDDSSDDVLFAPAGSNLSISMAGGAGGAGLDGLGGQGGVGTFELTTTNDVYIRSRIGKKGLDRAEVTTLQSDVNGGGTGSGLAGQGGGATSMLLSSDGVNWQAVAIIGGGGGHGKHRVGGAGGGLNQVGTKGGDYSSLSTGGTGGTLSTPGAGGVGGGAVGAVGGTPGNDAAANAGNGFAGQGDLLFMIGGGGGGAVYPHNGGGAGGGYYGGGGGAGYGTGGGGGSGFFDAAAIEAITGGVATISSNQTGGNTDDGYITFNATTAKEVSQLRQQYMTLTHQLY